MEEDEEMGILCLSDNVMISVCVRYGIMGHSRLILYVYTSILAGFLYPVCQDNLDREHRKCLCADCAILWLEAKIEADLAIGTNGE